jgi:hypothetical protein
MSDTTGILGFQIRDKAVANAQVSDTANIVEAKLSYDITTGHNHDGSNSRLISGAAVEPPIIDGSFTGDINGVNTDFAMAYSFVPNTVSVFRRGLRQKRTSHFTEISPNTVRFTTAPNTGDALVFDYVKA